MPAMRLDGYIRVGAPTRKRGIPLEPCRLRLPENESAPALPV